MTNGKIELSIIIISYNTYKITKNCLESIFKSLKNNHINYEILVVDNASSDDSLSMLKNIKYNDSNIRIIENKANIGFARANNQAVQLTKGEYILFLNSDTVVINDAINKLFDFYKKNEKTINFLGGKLLNADLTPQPSCGPFYSLPVIFAALFLRGDYWGLTRSSPCRLKEVDWVSGACILTKKSIFEKLGGFDEKIFMYMDEIDFLYRAKKCDFRVFFYPEAKFIHLGSASSGKRTFPILQVYSGFLYFYKKHHGALANKVLKFVLKLKAIIALTVGRITGNKYLDETYEKAYQMVKMA